MLRWRGLDSVPGGWGRSVVTIGVFDGVHRGHQQIIAHTVKRARETGVPAVVMTFDPHPAEVVRPGSHPAVLTEPSRKAELIAGLGVDALCVIPFTLDFSKLSAEGFVHDVLVDTLHAGLVVVGENFRFGHKAAGDVDLLRRLGRTFGFGVEEAPLVAAGDTVFSSTYIRSLIAAGDVGAAAAALGRPHRLEGVVVRGDQRGRQLGFPTANLMNSQYAAVPADGVYAARVAIGHPTPSRPGAGFAWTEEHGERSDRSDEGRPSREGPGPAPADAGASSRVDRMGAVSIGTNPTFSGRERRVEAFILDFDADIYGERIALDFVERLREQRTYTSLPPLVEQINDDVARTRSLLSEPGTVDESAG
jgi:riboflavin kinase/FMN adenylyltransferase